MNGIQTRTTFDRTRIHPVSSSAIGKRYRVIGDCGSVLAQGKSRKAVEVCGCQISSDLGEQLYLQREIGYPILGEYETVARISPLTSHPIRCNIILP